MVKVAMCDVSVVVPFEWVSYHAVLGLLVARHLKIKLKKEQVASNECVYIPLCNYSSILVS